MLHEPKCIGLRHNPQCDKADIAVVSRLFDFELHNFC